MSVFLQPIYTQTVGAGTANPIIFNNIPQTFTDLKLVVSAREGGTTAGTVGMNVYFNTEIVTTTNYSITGLLGNGASTSSDRTSSSGGLFFGNITPNAAQTTNTFSNVELYIPNYTGSNFKSCILDSVNENNATAAYQRLYAGLWRSTAAISTLSIYSGAANFVQYSTFSLYGVLRQGI